MYGEERPTLQKILAVAEENNQMLRRLQRARRWTSFFSVAKWLVIIGASVGAYYYLQPFLERWPAIWSQVQSLGENLNFLNPPPR